MHLLASQLRLSVCSPPHLPFEVSSDGFLVFSFHISPGCHFAFVLPLKSHVTWRSDGGGEPPKWIDFFQRLPAPIISIIAPLFSVIANWLVSIFSKTLPMLYKGSHHLKKSGNLWKLFIKWWPPPPVLLLWNPYFDFSRFFRGITFLNKRYEIRLIPPPLPPFVKKFHKIPLFFKWWLP